MDSLSSDEFASSEDAEQSNEITSSTLNIEEPNLTNNLLTSLQQDIENDETKDSISPVEYAEDICETKFHSVQTADLMISILGTKQCKIGNDDLDQCRNENDDIDQKSPVYLYTEKEEVETGCLIDEQGEETVHWGRHDEETKQLAIQLEGSVEFKTTKANFLHDRYVESSEKEDKYKSSLELSSSDDDVERQKDKCIVYRKRSNYFRFLIFLFSFFLHVSTLNVSSLSSIDPVCMLKDNALRIPKSLKNINIRSEWFVYAVPGPTFVPPEPPEPPDDVIQNENEFGNTTNYAHNSETTSNNNGRDFSHTVGNSLQETVSYRLNERNSSIYGECRNDNPDDFISLRNNSNSNAATQNGVSLTSFGYSNKSDYDHVGVCLANIRPPYKHLANLTYIGDPTYRQSQNYRTLCFLDGAESATVLERNENPNEIDNDNNSGTGFNWLEGDMPAGLSDRVNRVRTFRCPRWPHEYLTPEQMADAGLFYTGIGDKTQCFYCGNCLDHWTPGDDPIQEHKTHYPDCNFIRQIKSQTQLQNFQPHAERNRSESDNGYDSTGMQAQNVQLPVPCDIESPANQYVQSVESGTSNSSARIRSCDRRSCVMPSDNRAALPPRNVENRNDQRIRSGRDILYRYSRRHGFCEDVRNPEQHDTGGTNINRTGNRIRSFSHRRNRASVSTLGGENDTYLPTNNYDPQGDTLERSPSLQNFCEIVQNPELYDTGGTNCRHTNINRRIRSFSHRRNRASVPTLGGENDTYLPTNNYDPQDRSFIRQSRIHAYPQEQNPDASDFPTINVITTDRRTAGRLTRSVSYPLMLNDIYTGRSRRVNHINQNKPSFTSNTSARSFDMQVRSLQLPDSDGDTGNPELQLDRGIIRRNRRSKTRIRQSPTNVTLNERNTQSSEIQSSRNIQSSDYRLSSADRTRHGNRICEILDSDRVQRILDEGYQRTDVASAIDIK